MEKPSPSYIQTNHGSEDRDGENYRYFSIKFVKEIEYADSSSSQEDLLDHECRKKIRRDWSLKDGSDLKDQQSKKDEEKLEVKQLAVIPDTGVANLIEAWKQQTSHFQTMVEKNDELLEMNLRLMQEMSTIKTNNVHLQEELADVRQYVENMKRDLKQMVPTSTDLSKKYQDLVVSTSDHATCSTENTSPWFTVQDAKDDDNLQKEHFFSSIKARRLVGSKISLDETCPPSSPSGTTVITVCETPKTTAYGTCTETDKERSCTAISAQRTGKESYLNSGSSHSLLMRKFSNDQRSARTSSISSVNVNNEILNAHAENNLPSGKNTPVNGGQTTQDYSLTINQLSNDHKDCIENFPNAFWPIGNQDKASAAEIKDVLIRSSASSKSSLLLKSSVSHDSGLSKKESCNQMKGNRSVTFMDSVSNMSKMESVPEERSLSGTIQNITAASENAGVMSSSKEICVKDSIEETGSLSKPEDKFPFHKVLISSDGTQQQSQMGASGLLNERNDYFPKVLSASSQTITACSVPSSKETLSWQSSRDDTTQEICSLSKSDDKVPQTRSRTSGSLNERNDCLPKEPDASDYQNTSLKEKTPVSSSHEKVPLGHFSSPTTAARPSVWNSGSSCGPLPSPPLYRFMFPCTVSILQEKVKELCFKEKRAKSALGQDTKSSKKDSSRRQSAGVLPQDACQTSSPDRPITACQDREANSSSILDIPQRDNSLDPRNAWKRLAKTCLSSGRSSRIADLSTQLLYASKIRNLQFATVNRPATAPYQCTDLKQHSNNLSRTELSSHSLGTSGAKDLASFSSPYICIFACHVRLVRLDPRGIRCDTKMLHPNVEFVEVQILHLNEPGVYKVVMLSGTRVCASHFISKSMMLQSLSRSSLSAQKSKSSSCRETQKDGSMQGSVTRGLNPSSTASQQQRKLDVKDRYKSGNRFAAVVNALRTSATTTTTTTEEVTPGCSELTLSSLGPGWIYMALDMASKPLHMQCFVLVFPTQRLAIQFKAVFNRCREEVQQASDRILVALSTFGQRKSQQNANWSCVHTDAGASAAELVTSSEVLEDCRSGSVSWGESEKSETMKRADPGAQQRCCCTRVASSGALFGRSSCGRKPSSVGKNNYNTAGVMASDEDCIADSRSEVMASQRSACHSIILPASALISRSDPCCMCARKAGLYRTRDACRVRGCTKPFNPSFDARRHSIGGAVGTEDIVLCEESGLDIATYRRETWRKDAERCHSSSEHHVGLLGNCSCNCMNANDGDEATAFTDLDNEKSTYAFTTADTGDSVELHEAIRYSSYEENAHQIRRSTSAESTAAHAGTATRSELMELCLMESSRRGAGSQSRHRKEEEKGRHASCTEVSWKSSAPIRAIRAGPETTVKADWLAMSRAKEGRQEGGRQRHGTATDAFFGSGRLDTTARTDFDFLSPELQMDNRLWSSLGYLGKERKDGVSLTSDLNCQGHVDGATDMTEVFVEYSCCYCEDEDSLSIASDDNFLSLEDDDEENGAEEKNAANDPDDPGEAGRNTLPIDPQTTSSHQSTSKGSSTVNMPAAESDRKNTETLENKCGLHEEVSRGGQKEERDQKHSPGDDKMIAQQQVVSVAGRALDCRSTTCSQMSLRGGPAEEKRRARSPALRHGGHPDFRHRQGLFPSTSPRTASGTMVRGEAHAQNGDEADVQVEWAWPTGGEPHVRRPSLRQDDRGGECLPHLAEREHHQAGSQGDSRGFRECLVPLPSGSGNRRSSPASSRTPDSTFGEDEAVIVSRRDAYSIHPPRSGKCRVPGASESRRCWRDSPGRSTMRKSDVRPADTSPPTASAVSGAGGWQTRRGAWLCTTHPGWTDLNGEGAGLSTSCCVRIVREGDRAARLIVTQLKDDVVLCNRVIDAGLIITQPAKKPPGKVVRLVMSAWHKGKRMKVALLLRFRSSKLADQFIVALREAQRISRLSEDC